MNGIVLGPLFLAIASAGRNEPSENATLTHDSDSGTVAGKRPKTMKKTRIGDPRTYSQEPHRDRSNTGDH